MMANLIAREQMRLHAEIAIMETALRSIPESDRLFVMAQAMKNVTSTDTTYTSAGCYDWDITLDFRPVGERK